MMAGRRRATSPLTREITWLAIEQFCPCLVAGALVTIVLVRSAPESLWMLAGPLADPLQPGDLRLVPPPAAADLRRGGLLPGHGTD